MPYPVFVFTGTLLWSILIDALNAPLILNARAWFTGQPAQMLLLVWLVYRLAMPTLIERMSA